MSNSLALAALIFLLILTTSTRAASAADLEAGRRLYDSVCAACHGTAGRPDPASAVVQAFDPPPADLSDALFNSREPASDWALVVKHGGHALGLSAQMPAQGESLSDRDIRDVVAYVKTLADTAAYPPGEMNLMLPVRTKKAFPEDEIVWKSRWTDQAGDDEFRNVIEFEKRIGRRGQAILEVIHENQGSESEIAEVEIGYKHVLAYDLERGSLLSGAVVVALPSAEEASEEIAPYLAYARRLSSQSTFQSSARVKLPVDDVDQGELELAGVVHYVWTQWPRRIFPALEMTATVPFEDDGGDAVEFTALPQLRFGLTRGGHVALNLGVEIPLSDQDYDYRAHLTLLWDFADGSFFKGW